MVLTATRITESNGEPRVLVPPPSQDDRLWTGSEVADYLSRPERTLRAWRTRGLIPAVVDPGGHLRYRAGSIRALVREYVDLDQGSLVLPDPEDDDRLWGDHECGELLGRSARTIRTWRRNGWLPTVRDPSGAWKFRAGTIRRLVRDAEGLFG